MRAITLEELLLVALEVHDRVFLDKLYLDDSVSCVHSLVELDSELFDLLG